MLLDGGSAEHLLGKTEMEVIIVAHVQDAKGQVLGDVPVTFTATSEPADIESSIRTVDTEDDEEDKEHGNAQRKISGLPLSGTYRVTVAVSADGVDLGSIVIVRPGNLDSVMATACFDDAKNKADDDGCGMGRRPQSVFKRGDSFVIVAQAKDALGTVIMPDKSSVEIPADAADSFGAPMADAEKKVFTIAIEDDAMSGVYNLTVKAEQNLANSTMLTETAMVSVTISGDLTQYAVTGPSRIPAGRIETYTVSALDANGAPATIKTTGDGKNDKVTVLVTGSGASDIRVLDLGANEKTLADDGTSTFRIFAPPNAPDSEIIITIIGVMGTETVTKQVNIGDNRAPMAVGTLEAITLAPGATQDVDVADAFSDSDGDMLVYTAMATPEGLTVTVAGSVITLTAGEANAMVTVTVMATDPSGAGAAQSLMVSVAPNDLLTSPDNVEATADDTTITVTWTPGVNASRGHLVLLFSTPDFELVQFADPTVSGTHTFTGLDPGTYVAVVVSIRQMSEYLYEFVLVTVLAPAAAAM
jgi:plastocyanin